MITKNWFYLFDSLQFFHRIMLILDFLIGKIDFYRLIFVVQDVINRARVPGIEIRFVFNYFHKSRSHSCQFHFNNGKFQARGLMSSKSCTNTHVYLHSFCWILPMMKMLTATFPEEDRAQAPLWFPLLFPDFWVSCITQVCLA